MAKTKTEEILTSNHIELNSMSVTLSKINTLISNGSIQNVSLDPHTSKHMSLLLIFCAGVQLESWLKYLRMDWVKHIKRTDSSNKINWSFRDKKVFFENIFKHAKSCIKDLKLTRKERKMLIDKLNKAKEGVIIIYNIRNQVAHGESKVALTKFKKKPIKRNVRRPHNRLSNIMQNMTHKQADSLLEDLHLVLNVSEVLISGRYNDNSRLKRTLIGSVARVPLNGRK